MMTFEEMEIFAKENYIPIARKDFVQFLIETIKENHYKEILEIGSAIGYTSCQVGLLEGVHVTTFEYYEPRYTIAKQNIKDYHLEDKVTLITDDVLKYSFDKEFDVIFIDGAKAKTIDFFEHFKNNISEKGMIIIDNIDLKVVEQIEREHKRHQYERIVDRTKEYFSCVYGYYVEYNPVGDGIYIITKA